MRHAVFLIPLFFIIHTTQAQESLSKDISYEYLDKLVAVCKANYPRVKMYEARVHVAENGLKKAKLSYFDIFSFSYLFSPNNNVNTISPTFGGYQFGFFANIGSILQKPNTVKQAKWEVDAARYDKDAFDLNMESEVKKRYFSYIQKIVILRLRSGALLDVESMLSTVKHRFERGEESLENYNKALLMQSDHSQNIVNAESEVLMAKSNLEELIGQKLEDIK
ncbi:TolC family protein [Dyadobacter sp. CY323]|uniref:TolC family protein n=1 Tax=Dyadobacter sp. CY323 TaxID=2907302 RepID=UPI001F1BF34A|nr:TolC family protein [Dyadobacter sp. CY323]MCE6987637.1 TolC family protein [Dyadobacter sp. CY323]